MNRAPDFNRLARLYRWMEFFSFGPWLALTRRTYVEELGGARHAVVLGDGDGRFTARLLRTNLAVQVDAVDASAAMLSALRRRAVPHASRLRTHLADIRAWQPAAGLKPDLIATHFFLDCLTSEEVAALAVRLRGICTPGARWVVSEFAIPPGWGGRFLARPLIGWLYLAFGLLTGLKVRKLPDHAAALQQAGFTLAGRRTRLGALLIAEMWQTDRAAR